MLDIRKILKEKGLTQQQINFIEAEVRSEFPNDEMMYELHLMRLVYSLIHGYCGIEDILPSKKRAKIAK